MHGLERVYFFSVPRWPLLFHPRRREERKNILGFHMDRNPNCGDFIVIAGKTLQMSSQWSWSAE